MTDSIARMRYLQQKEIIGSKRIKPLLIPFVQLPLLKYPCTQKENPNALQQTH